MQATFSIENQLEKYISKKVEKTHRSNIPLAEAENPK